MSWSKDNKGFFYQRYEAPKHGEFSKAGMETDKLQNQKVYYHKLGDKQSEDLLVYENKEEPEWMFAADVTEDGKYLVIQSIRGTEKKNLFHYTSIDGSITKDTKFEFTPLIKEWMG